MISRRSFLGASVSAAALAAPAAQAAPQDSAAGFHLGVASYSLRKFTRAQAIQMIREMDVKYVNIKDVHLPLDSTPEQIREARKEFDDAGLIIEGGGNISFAKDDEADIRHKFEYAKMAGLPIIVCAPTHVTLPKLEKFVKEYDIKIALHNHGPEDHQFPTPQSALEAMKGMDPRCGLCIDVGHTARTGVNVVEAIRLAGPRLISMHLKDLSEMDAKESQCDVGMGKMPIPAIFRQLNAMGYHGGAMLEYEIHPDDPLPGMERSFAYMRGVLAGMRT